MTTMKLAVPTMGEAGLEAQRAGHFGHCDRFTIVTIEDGKVLSETGVVENPPHESGGCLRPVGLLAGEGVDAIVAAGMGGRPLAGFNQVGDAAAAVAAGEAPVMDPSQACQHHH